MSAIQPAWRRWTLLAALFAIGMVWIAAFALFRARSEDFVAVRIDAAASDRARTPAPGLPVTLSFGSGLGAEQLLGDGWWPVDEGGVWSWSERAHVWLRWPRGVDSFRLGIEGDVFVPGRSRPRVRLYANDALLGEWTAHRDDTVVQEFVRVDGPAPRDGLVMLTIEIDRVASPFRTQPDSKDTRYLGFHLRKLELAPVPATTASP
ncbi:MAG TPA: hypothetical protein VFL14_12090 [Xanthomonadales bacterium]|nr:hypothetical protein [Xanthomonadales bacterium]